MLAELENLRVEKYSPKVEKVINVVFQTENAQSHNSQLRE